MELAFLPGLSSVSFSRRGRSHAERRTTRAKVTGIEKAKTLPIRAAQLCRAGALEIVKFRTDRTRPVAKGDCPASTAENKRVGQPSNHS